MSGLFQPNPTVLALLTLQTFFYLPLVAILACCRCGAGRRAARWLAALALAVALVGMAAHFGPPLLKLHTGPWPQYASVLTKAGGGMALPLAASLPLLLSGLAPGRRWKWLDWVHICLLLALLGLWGWTRYF